MSVNIYVADVSCIKENEFNKYTATMSAFRKEKYNKLKLTEDKRLCIGATILLDFALKTYGVNEVDMSYLVNEYGKPVLADYPNIHFSISHSNNYVACAIGDKPLGCDIEKVGRLDMKIAGRFLTPSECRKLDRLDTNEQRLELAGIWTVKESYAKALGRGVNSVLDTDISGINYNINTFYDINDYVLSCCSEDNDVELNIIDIKNGVE